MIVVVTTNQSYKHCFTWPYSYISQESKNYENFRIVLIKSLRSSPRADKRNYLKQVGRGVVFFIVIQIFTNIGLEARLRKSFQNLFTNLASECHSL